jgi:hypothetical protein
MVIKLYNTFDYTVSVCSPCLETNTEAFLQVQHMIVRPTLSKIPYKVHLVVYVSEKSGNEKEQM